MSDVLCGRLTFHSKSAFPLVLAPTWPLRKLSSSCLPAKMASYYPVLNPTPQETSLSVMAELTACKLACFVPAEMAAVNLPRGSAHRYSDREIGMCHLVEYKHAYLLWVSILLHLSRWTQSLLWLFLCLFASFLDYE